MSSRRNSSERGDEGKFLKKCSCIMHIQWSHDHLFDLRNVTKTKLYASNIIRQMKTDGIISKRSNILCTACYKTFRARYKYFIFNSNFIVE